MEADGERDFGLLRLVRADPDVRRDRREDAADAGEAARDASEGPRFRRLARFSSRVCLSIGFVGRSAGLLREPERLLLDGFVHVVVGGEVGEAPLLVDAGGGRGRGADRHQGDGDEEKDPRATQPRPVAELRRAEEARQSEPASPADVAPPVGGDSLLAGACLRALPAPALRGGRSSALGGLRCCPGLAAAGGPRALGGGGLLLVLVVVVWWLWFSWW